MRLSIGGRWIIAILVVVGLGAVATALAWTLSNQPPDRTGSQPPTFVDDAVTAGVSHAYAGEFTFFVGGGVAVFDCDDDRRPDLYFAGGSSPAALYRNESEVGGELRFTALPDVTTDHEGVVGAYPLDIDGDGITDLAVLRLGENFILRGKGDCRFDRANEALGLDGGDEWTTAFSARWEDPEGLPTLAFGNYLALEDGGTRAGGCSPNALVRPAGDGYGTPLPLTPGWCSLSILFSDWDRSGGGDLRISNDRQYYRDGEEQLWRIEPGETPELYTADDGWKLLRINGMGIASYDVTGDGLPEFFLTSQGDNKLQTLAEEPTRPVFDDIALARGVTAHRPFIGDEILPSTAWHPEFQDVNNDGNIDLYVAKGNVDSMVEFAAEDPNNLLLGQADGTFVEHADAAGVASVDKSRGAAIVDLNLDGMLDIVQVNRRENVNLWRSVGWGDADRPADMGRWLGVAVEQPAANRSAIGAWIELDVGGNTQWRELTVGGGHAGGQLGWIHFGLGANEEARIRVHWPDGEIGPWLDVASDEFVILERGAATAQRWVP